MSYILNRFDQVLSYLGRPFGLGDRLTEIISPYLPLSCMPTRANLVSHLSNPAFILDAKDPRQIAFNQIYATTLRPTINWDRKRIQVIETGGFEPEDADAINYQKRPKLPEKIEVLKENPLILAHPELPAWVIKLNANSPDFKLGAFGLITPDFLSRVPMSERIRQIIERDHLDKLYCVKKVFAHIPDRATELNEDNYAVLAEKLDLTSEKETDEIFQSLSPKEQRELVRQLYHMMIKSGYADGHKHNFAFIKSGPHQSQLAIYDTESLGLCDLLKRARPCDHIYGYSREVEVKCGISGMNQSISVEGLPIDKTLLRGVYNEFKAAADREILNNKMKRVALRVLPLIPVVACIAIPIVWSAVFQR